MAGGKQMKSVWQIAAPERDEKHFGKHPTQKPVALLERIILAASNEGDLVLDPFMGGGSTLLAALRRERAVLGVELDAAFVDLSLRRIFAVLFRVHHAANYFEGRLDLHALFMDRSIGQVNLENMAPSSKLVHRERKYFFVGSCRREVIYAVVAPSLEEAWKSFQSESHTQEQIISVIKTETEIYLAQ